MWDGDIYGEQDELMTQRFYRSGSRPLKPIKVLIAVGGLVLIKLIVSSFHIKKALAPW